LNRIGTIDPPTVRPHFLIPSLLILLLVGGCGEDASDIFSQGLEEYRAERWDSAARRFGDALVIDPGLTASHFYIGMCYLRTDPPWPVVAAGELTIALEFLEEGELEPLPGSASDEVRAQIHVGLGDAYRLQARIELLRTGKVNVFAAMLDKALLEYQTATQLHPADAEIERKMAELQNEKAALVNAVPFVYER
jgi:hypothetical protein